MAATLPDGERLTTKTVAIGASEPRHRDGEPSRALLVPVLVVAVCTAIVAVIIAGPWSLAHVALYVLATMPGWPLGRALFGRDHPAGWFTGAIIGYGLTSLALWAVVALRVPSFWPFALAWAATTAAAWMLTPRGAPCVTLPPWSRTEARTLVLLLLIVPAVFVLPYKNLGARDEAGNRFYRAYFTADFVWHTALTAELMKYDMPPRNPYMGDQPVHYYWTYFLVPAVVAQEGPTGLRDVESALKVNALCSGILFIGALILATWCASFSATATALAVILAVLAASGEGLHAVWDLIANDRSLARLKNLNIDAISAWNFGGLRVDSLMRSMWYNPQHSMSAALGLMATAVAGQAGAAAPLGAVVLAGVLLALSTTMNPFIGGLFSLIYGAVIVADVIRTRQVRWLLPHAAAAALVGAAVVWCVANQMVEGASGVVVFGFGGNARNAPLITLILSLGPLLVPALLGMWAVWRLPRAVWPSVAGTVLGLVAFYLVRLSVDASYVGFRAGQILQLTMSGLAAVFLARLARSGWRTAAVAAASLFIALGLPTTVIDIFNAQDIGNLSQGPGFRWTVTVTPDEQEAFQWIRGQTPAGAVVQMDPFAHGQETWSQLPTFAWRRMAAAMPISLMSVPEYEERSRRVNVIYGSGEPEPAALAARELGIDYLFIGPAEVAEHPAASLRKFETRPDLFRKVFGNAGTRIFEVLPAP